MQTGIVKLDGAAEALLFRHCARVQQPWLLVAHSPSAPTHMQPTVSNSSEPSSGVCLWRTRRCCRGASSLERGSSSEGATLFLFPFESVSG